MPKFLALSGLHSSGKTSVGTYLVEKLLERGYRVGVIKSTKETEDLTDAKNTDTARYKRAGAEKVLLLQGSQATLYLQNLPSDQDKALYFFEKIFSGYDLVLCEGFKGWRSIPKVWIKSEGAEDVEALRYTEGILLVVSSNDKEKVLELALGLLEGLPEPKLSLYVNEDQIPLKPHLKDLFQNLLLAITKSLKDMPSEIETVELRLRLR